MQDLFRFIKDYNELKIDHCITRITFANHYFPIALKIN